METSTYEQQAIDFLTSTQTEFKTEFKEFGSMAWDTDGQKRNIFTCTLKNAKHSYSFEFGSSIADSTKERKRAKIQSNEKTEIFFGFKHNTEKGKGNVIFSHTIKTSYQQLKAIKEGTENLDVLINDERIAEDFTKYIENIKEYNSKKYNFGHGHYTIKGSNIDEITARIRQRVTDSIKQAEQDFDTLNDEQADEIKHPSAYDVLTCLQKYDPGTFKNFCSDFGYDSDSRSAIKTYKSVRKEWQNVSMLFTDSELDQLQEIQ